MTQPYRTLDMCERYRFVHGSPKQVTVMRQGAWRWGPFAAGTIRWGDETFRVWATPWFSFWWKSAPIRCVAEEPKR